MTYLNTKWTKGTIYRFAGTGIAGYHGDGGEANTAQLNGPAGLAIDKDNNIFIAEMHNHVIRKIDAKTRIISTVAGCGSKGFAGDGELAIHAKLNSPLGVFTDKVGNIFIADSLNQRIRKVDARTGVISTVAGTGDAGYNEDGIQACEAKLNYPAGVVADSIGNVYFNDFKNDRIRKICTNGIISTYAGTGINGYSGDFGQADKAMINGVYGLAIDRHDNIYIMDSLNFAVRKVDAKLGIINTIIGKGNPGPINEFDNIANSFIGEPINNQGSFGSEDVAHSVEVDLNGNLFIGDTASNRIRMVDIERDLVYSIAGTGEKGLSGDNDFALNANLSVHGLKMDSKNNLYFIDFLKHVIRVIKF
ncbi:hypothetical protein [Desulfosporosinus nitroreducens]|uniref:Teneurin NHL domain-containing protein n=1 Tax=Desulfosporosinus nitroreducens TaxID=2018668 RepID=A0ABT8QXC7_9FIRM|nr:hypothetical protein [Desulfosporosinus nitroreducens]MDO0825995.1 hypothetical protein [Desulfosporosinus nitroreducens]